jgi:predicted ferric reductase
MRKLALYGILAGSFLLAIADVIATRMRLVNGAVPRAEGPWIWTSSRAAGVAGYLALSLDVIFGLFISTGFADRWISRGRTVEIHQWLSGASLALIATHGLLLLGDSFIRFDLLDVIVPFIDPYRPAAVGLGVLAAYAAFFIHWSFSLRRTIGVATWRKLHHLTFLLFVLATAHGVLAGTDARLPWVAAMYTTAGGLVAAFALYRVFPGIACLMRNGGITQCPLQLTAILTKSEGVRCEVFQKQSASSP